MGRGSIKRLWLVMAMGICVAITGIGHAETIDLNSPPNNFTWRTRGGLIGSSSGYGMAATPTDNNLSVEGKVSINTSIPDCVMTIQRGSAFKMALGLRDGAGAGNSVDTAWFPYASSAYAWDLTFRNGAGGSNNLQLFRAGGHLVMDCSSANGNVGIGTLATSTDVLTVKGNINATGYIYNTSGVKLFKINHPTKKGMDLMHACMEGPEAGVYYHGEAQLSNGTAVVNLPEYFEALTRKDSRTVLLTAKGREPFLLSCAHIIRGSFAVYGTKPDGKFSWEVQAVRGDIKPLEAEVPKTAGELKQTE